MRSSDWSSDVCSSDLLELTESLTLDDTETTIRIMDELKQLGIGLSLDDFGTGWSSLSYLRRFPLDRIKIARSFMRDVTTPPNAGAVVQRSEERRVGKECVSPCRSLCPT